MPATNWANRRGAVSGHVSAAEMAQGLGRLGFAAISLDWERPFLRLLYAWSSAMQGKPGLMKIPAVLRVLFSWLADRFEKGDRLQRPLRPPGEAPPISFFTDAKAENGRVWTGGFLEIARAATVLFFARSGEVLSDATPIINRMRH